MAIFECEIRLQLLAPAAFVVEVYICALLIVFCAQLWLVVALEPRQKVLMIPPRLLLQFACSQILMRRTLLEVEHEEECIGRKFLEDCRVIKDRSWDRRETRWGVVRVARSVWFRSLGVSGVGGVPQAGLKHRQVVHVVVVYHLAWAEC